MELQKNTPKAEKVTCAGKGITKAKLQSRVIQLMSKQQPATRDNITRRRKMYVCLKEFTYLPPLQDGEEPDWYGIQLIRSEVYTEQWMAARACVLESLRELCRTYTSIRDVLKMPKTDDVFDSVNMYTNLIRNLASSEYFDESVNISEQVQTAESQADNAQDAWLNIYQDTDWAFVYDGSSPPIFKDVPYCNYAFHEVFLDMPRDLVDGDAYQLVACSYGSEDEFEISVHPILTAVHNPQTTVHAVLHQSIRRAILVDSNKNTLDNVLKKCGIFSNSIESYPTDLMSLNKKIVDTHVTDNSHPHLWWVKQQLQKQNKPMQSLQEECIRRSCSITHEHDSYNKYKHIDNPAFQIHVLTVVTSPLNV